MDPPHQVAYLMLPPPHWTEDCHQFQQINQWPLLHDTRTPHVWLALPGTLGLSRCILRGHPFTCETFAASTNLKQARHVCKIFSTQFGFVFHVTKSACLVLLILSTLQTTRPAGPTPQDKAVPFWLSCGFLSAYYSTCWKRKTLENWLWSCSRHWRATSETPVTEHIR